MNSDADASTGDLVDISEVSRIFVAGDIETHALASVSFTVQRGDYVSIEGPSGSGKSTLLAVLGLLDVPGQGSYRLNNQDVSKLNARNRAKIRNEWIGFIFQSFNLIADLTVEENVALPLTYRSKPPADTHHAVQRALDRVEMSHRKKHYPSQLSGGQQQRVAVARALVGDPLLLLADEPTGNLDTRNGDAVMRLLSELHRDGATICLVTHNVDYARCARRAIHLVDGIIIDDAPLAMSHGARGHAEAASLTEAGA
jgi:putative ABC transport system ATP-binding protein